MEELAYRELDEDLVAQSLVRHIRGDWGDVASERALANHDAIRNGGRIVSIYLSWTGRFLIITETNRLTTTIRLHPDG